MSCFLLSFFKGHARIRFMMILEIEIVEKVSTFDFIGKLCCIDIEIFMRSAVLFYSKYRGCFKIK